MLVSIFLSAGCRSEQKEAFLKQNRAVYHFEKLGGQILSPEQTDEGVWTLLLSHCKVQNSDLKPLVELPHIQAVHLEETGINDEAITYLSPLTRLLELNLGQTNVTDEGVKQLTAHPHLKRLHLNQTKVSDECCESLATFSELTGLIISQTMITNEGLVEIGKLESLRALWMNDLSINDTGFAALSELEDLSELTLQRTEITDESWKFIETLPRIETLDFIGCQLLTTIPGSIGGSLPQLQNLWMSDTGLHGNALIPLKACSQLELLAISRTQVDEESLQALAELPKLQFLYARALEVDRGVLEKLKLSMPDSEIVY